MSFRNQMTCFSLGCQADLKLFSEIPGKLSPNWTCLYFSETKISFDPNLNPWDTSLGANGLFTLGTWCSRLSQGLRPPNQAPEKGPRRRRYILGRVKLLARTGLASTPALLPPEHSSASPRGGFGCSDFSHTLLSNEFKPFLVQIPTEEKKKK